MLTEIEKALVSPRLSSMSLPVSVNLVIHNGERVR